MLAAGTEFCVTVSCAREARPLCRAFCFCRFNLHCQCDGRDGARSRCLMEAATKLQKAGRAFLLRLVAAFGPLGAARGAAEAGG